MKPFSSGMLRDLIARVSELATARGALQPIETRIERIDDRGIGFAVRIADSLRGKSASSEHRPADFDPFLPYDEEMFVADASATHVCLLNKYKVLDEHLLIVTRAFEEQRSPLTLADFEALLRCMAEYPSLGFYNSGPAAGASQRHKHLQLVPLPLCDWAPLPLRPADLAALGIPHEVATPSESSGWSAPELLGAYQSMRSIHGDYNLLVTDDTLLVVPRRQESACGISVNALGFAGSLFVPDRDGVDRIRANGPAFVLQEVAQM